MEGVTDPSPFHIDSAEAIARDIAAIGNIGAVPSMLRIVCQATGMGFAAVARVTDGTWTACAVQDDIEFGMKPGGQLPVGTTLCIEARSARRPVVFDHASESPTYRDHHTPRLYNIESYISVPIVMPDGAYFGNLCAIDPKPHKVSEPQTVAVFERFAELIAMQLDSERQRFAVETQLTDERATTELREHFIAVLGHDLRNPLSSIAATAELLQRRTAEPEVVRIAQRLKSTTRRMGKLIDDVLDFARGRLGSGIGVALQPVEELGALLGNVVAELQDAHPDRRIVAAIDVGGPVTCDAGRIQQLLSNLLGNAISHGDAAHPILVDARLLALDGGHVLEIAVANQGEPIPAELQGKVFEPYWRPATSQPGGGLGLGLYICSQIVKAHGGGLGVTSSAEKGTRFVAQVPAGEGASFSDASPA